MHRPSNLHLVDDRAFCRPEGSASAGERADTITAALEYFYDHTRTRLSHGSTPCTPCATEDRR